jgi:RNA polymerase sigma-70 factor, ECF subfamily
MQKDLFSCRLETTEKLDIALLVGRLKNAEESAFSELYDRYSGALNGVIKKMIRDEDRALDILQDSLVKIWKNIHSYDPSKGSFFTWMLNITRNTAIDALRRMKKEGFSENHENPAFVNQFAAVEQNVSLIGLSKLVDELLPEQKQMIEYIYFKGYTQQEVADELDMPLGTVKTRTRIAMRELRKWFKILVLWM